MCIRDRLSAIVTLAVLIGCITIGTGTVFAATAPWTKNENGQFVNGNGDIIKGATMKGIDVSHYNGNIDWKDVYKRQGGMPMKFGFIGAGKVGFSLGKYLADNEMEVVGYYSEFKEDALEASKFTKSSVYKNIEDLVRDSDVLFLTVPDGAIEKVWNQVKKTGISGKVVCHCSGALSSKVFSDISELGGFGYSIHPLFAVSDRYNSYKELSNSYFTIEGSPEKIGEIRQIFEKMGNKICIISAKMCIRDSHIPAFVHHFCNG